MQRLCLEKPETEALKNKHDLFLNHPAEKILKEKSSLNTLHQSNTKGVTIVVELSINDKIKPTKESISSLSEINLQECCPECSIVNIADNGILHKSEFFEMLEHSSKTVVTIGEDLSIPQKAIQIIDTMKNSHFKFNLKCRTNIKSKCYLVLPIVFLEFIWFFRIKNINRVGPFFFPWRLNVFI
jgi:hypothetical protein